VAEFVGPTGHVLGVDSSAEALAVARDRVEQSGVEHVRFEEGDVATWQAPTPFDAIVTRLLLLHLRDPAAVIRHHLENLRRGGLFVAIDFDTVASRTEPPVPIADGALQWVRRAFHAAGVSARIGARLGTILSEAGLSRVETFGVQGYLPPHDPAGPALLAGVVRTLAPVIVQHGIATAEALDVATLEQRIGAAVRDANAVILPPTVVGAWGRRD
jgi:SAM-dependent methyltransferase